MDSKGTADTLNTGLTPIDDALHQLLPLLPKIQEEEFVPLLQATGRVLASDICAAIDVPPHDNSAMDGYAVRVDELGPGETQLSVVQRIAAGQLGVRLNQGEAARIFTGAPLPAGADAVAMQENCSLDGTLVRLLKPVVKGENLRRSGEDVKSGSVLFKAGHRFRAQDIGLLASIGLTQVALKRRLKLALLTTGDELVKPGANLAPGQIYNSNFYTLSSLLAALDVEVLDLGIVGDSLENTLQVLEKAAAEADCIISTGGVSVGEEDYVKAAVESLGSLDLWKLAIKPGKPLACGKVKDVQFFGLPGNPVSAFVTFVLVVRPCLLAMLGVTHLNPQKFRIAADFEHAKSAQRQEYLRSTLQVDESGKSWLKPYLNQSSGVVTSLSEAHGLVIIPPYTAVSPGDNLDFIPFSELLN